MADIALRDWEALAVRLTPIIGQRGLRALFARSLHLTQSAFPCLAPPVAEATGPVEVLFAGLGRSLQAQPPLLAREAHEALLSTFTGLLNSLIGEALTAQLIQSEPPQSGQEHHRREPPR